MSFRLSRTSCKPDVQTDVQMSTKFILKDTIGIWETHGIVKGGILEV